jgi:hypothetical protein
MKRNRERKEADFSQTPRHVVRGEINPILNIQLVLFINLALITIHSGPSVSKKRRKSYSASINPSYPTIFDH